MANVKPSVKSAAMMTLSASANPPAVVMGIIDDGIAFANERFRRILGGTIGSRVEHWWLQDGPYKPNFFPFLPLGSQNVPSGCELDKAQIDDLVRTFRATRPAPGTSGPLLPGDPEREAQRVRDVSGVPLPAPVVEHLREISLRTGVEL